MLCYCIYKMAFQKIIIVLELIDVFNRLCAWNFYLVEGWAACQEDKNKSREASTWQIHSQGLAWVLSGSDGLSANHLL